MLAKRQKPMPPLAEFYPDISDREQIILWLDRVRKLQKQRPLKHRRYYFISRFAEGEKIQTACDSVWCGFTKTAPYREIRTACEVNPTIAIRSCRLIDQPAMLINSIDDLVFYLTYGGYAVVERGLVNKFFPHLMQQSEVFRHSNGLGYIDIDDSHPVKKQRAPSRKLRMQVLNRDGRKCVICGCSPTNYVNLELHVHHIIPWSAGGITEETNLVTLCNACHGGLEPHFDFSLRNYIPTEIGPSYMDRLAKYQIAYVEMLKNSFSKR